MDSTSLSPTEWPCSNPCCLPDGTGRGSPALRFMLPPGGGQFDAEPGPPALAAPVEPSAVRLACLPGNAQTQPDPPRFARHEWLEQPLRHRCRRARAAVQNLDGMAGRLRLTADHEPDFDGAAGAGRLHCIVDDV